MERLEESENKIGLPPLRFAVSPFWRRVVMLCLFFLSAEIVFFVFVVYSRNPGKIQENFLSTYSNSYDLATQILNEPGAECLNKNSCAPIKTMPFYFDGQAVRLALGELRSGFNAFGQPCEGFSDSRGSIMCPFAMRVEVQNVCVTPACDRFDIVFRTHLLHRPGWRLLKWAVTASAPTLSGRFPLSSFQAPAVETKLGKASKKNNLKKDSQKKASPKKAEANATRKRN